MRTILTFVLILAIITVQAQTGAKKGPPNLSGNWVMKNSDGTVKRHFTATQSGNYVKFQCTDAGETDRTYVFNWDVPGNYILMGNVTGIKFDQTYYKTTVKGFYKRKYGISDGGNSIWFRKDGRHYRISEGTDTPINYSLCEPNSFTIAARFTVSETLDNIHVDTKSVWIDAPEPTLQTVYDLDGRRPVISGSATSDPAAEVTAKPSSDNCGVIRYSNSYDDSFNLVRVKDSW